jgi:hypothetical protein
MAMKIITRYDPKPIPDRQFDWSAWEDGGNENMVGCGTTKEAIIDLARLFAEGAEEVEQQFYEKHRRLEALDHRIVACEACGTEGRIFHGNGDKPWDYVEECPYCDGTGGEIITTQPIEMADLDAEGA